MKKGHLFKFIEQAVQKAVFSHTVADIDARNSAVSDADIEAAIDDALRQVRAERWGARSKKSPENPRRALSTSQNTD